MLNLAQGLRGITMCLSNAGLAIGSTASKAKIAGTDPAGINFCINGVMYYKANTDNCILFTGLTQTNLTSCIYLVCVDEDLAVTVVQGTEVTTADITAGDAVLEFPQPTADTCPIGYIRLDMSGGAFTGATTELSDATVTDTYVNLAQVPDKPLTS